MYYMGIELHRMYYMGIELHVCILVSFTTDSAAKLPLYKPFIFLLSMI
jgi:hypothetical protein